MKFSRKLALGLLAAGAVCGAGLAWWLLPPGALAFAGGKTVSLANYSSTSPTGVPASFAAADLVTRGHYLTQAADCEVCHTKPGGTPFAGGLAFKTPFGTLYSPNITPDRQTGIGTWSDADFIRAVHKGVARGGIHLYPAFPYESYTLITDADVLAIKAYLFSLKPANAAPPPNSLSFPFNQRALMAVWSLFYNPDHRFQPHTDRTAQWNRGAYLAEALGHCGDCHTPRNLAQALDNRHKFAGALTDGWHAYNITGDKNSGLGAWSDAELAHYLAHGHAPGRGAAAGPMGEVVNASLSALAPQDVDALVAYLRSIPPIDSPNLPAPKPTPASDLPKQMQAAFDPRGKQIFEGACVSCHGWSGISPLTYTATLTGNRSVNDSSAINVAQVVLSGAAGRTANGIVTMPAFGNGYTDTEIAAVANYVTARFGAEPSQITAADVAALHK